MADAPPVVVQRVLPHAPDVVFDRFVSEIGDWWVPRTAPWAAATQAPAALTLEARPAGEVREGTVSVGSIIEWRRGEVVVFTLHGSRVCVTFAPHPRGTRLELVHTGWAPWADPSVLDVRSFEDVVRAWWLDAALRL